MTTLYNLGGGALAAFCWALVSIVALLAVFSPTVKDTPAERLALSLISITAAGTACRVIAANWVSEGGFWLSVAFAVYACVIVRKHMRNPDHRMPWDKSRHGRLENLPHPKGTR